MSGSSRSPTAPRRCRRRPPTATPSRRASRRSSRCRAPRPGAGLRAALDSLKITGDAAARRPPSAIVLLSDGSATDGGAADEAAAEAKRLRVPIYTVALGTPDGTITLGGQVLRVPPDPEALKRIAQESGGVAFSASDSDQLNAVYDRLGSQIGTKPEKREVTALFAGLALLLLGGAVASSLKLGGRLP